MEDTIRLTLGNWQNNVGIVGLLRTLNVNTEEDLLKSGYLSADKQSLELPTSILDGFAEKYFDYLLKLRRPVSKIVNIISFKDYLLNLKETKDVTIDDIERFKKELDFIHEKLKGRVVYKKYLTDLNSYDKLKSVLAIPKGSLTLTSKSSEKLISKNFAKQQDIVLNNIDIMLDFIECLEDDYKGNQLLARAENIFYISKFLDNKFGFASLKYGDYIERYNNIPLYALHEYLDEDTSDYKHNCYYCNNPMKKYTPNSINQNQGNYVSSAGSVFGLGMDYSKKVYSEYFGNVPIKICPVCSWLCSLLPIGVNAVYPEKGIFVNYSANIVELLKINNSILHDFYNSDKPKVSYGDIIKNIRKVNLALTKKRLGNVQIINFSEGNLSEDILNKNVLSIMDKSSDYLDEFSNVNYKDNSGNWHNIGDEVISKLNNGLALDSYIADLLRSIFVGDIKLSGKKIVSLIQVNKIIKEKYNMTDNKELQELINKFNKYGWYMAKDYYEITKNEKSINSHIYKLLNANRVNNIDLIVNEVLALYSYTGKQIPKDFINNLGNKEDFKLLMGSYIAGLMSTNIKSNNENGEQN